MKSLWLRCRIWIARWRRWPHSRRLKTGIYSESEKRRLIAGLTDHPGWKLLMADLEMYRAGFEAMQINATKRIRSDANAEKVLREIMRTDEAITWTGWLQWRIKKANAMPALKEFEPPSADVREMDTNVLQ